jgi:hypothetical protein
LWLQSSFDWFHLCKVYTTFLLLDRDAYPDEMVQTGRRDGVCGQGWPLPEAGDGVRHHASRPEGTVSVDLMARSDIRIKKIPTVLAYALAKELEERVQLSDIYFAKRKNKFEPKWKVYDREDEDGNPEPDFKDIVLKFNASSALKALATDALKLPPDKTLLFADVNVDAAFMPEEEGYAPYAMAHWKNGKWNGAWPDVVHHHIRHWAYDSLARKYAGLDVEYTRDLYKFFGSPEVGDDDSVLACMVGAVRWRGYSIDTEGMKELRHEAILRQGKFPTAPEQVRRYVYQHMSRRRSWCSRTAPRKPSSKRSPPTSGSSARPAEGLAKSPPTNGYLAQTTQLVRNAHNARALRRSTIRPRTPPQRSWTLGRRGRKLNSTTSFFSPVDSTPALLLLALSLAVWLAITASTPKASRRQRLFARNFLLSTLAMSCVVATSLGLRLYLLMLFTMILRFGRTC